MSSSVTFAWLVVVVCACSFIVVSAVLGSQLQTSKKKLKLHLDQTSPPTVMQTLSPEALHMIPNPTQANVIVYYHMCCKGTWLEITHGIMSKLRQATKVYQNMVELRIGIVEHSTQDEKQLQQLLADLNIEKYTIIFRHSSSAKYERPTLLHMQAAAITKDADMFMYLHSKGISHTDTSVKTCVKHWVIAC